MEDNKLSLIKKYWEKYLIQNSIMIHETIKELNEVVNSWKIYKHKINDNTFELIDYTNLIPNEYLCNFLERGSKILSSSRPGNSSQYGIYRAQIAGEVKYLASDKNRSLDPKEVNIIFGNIKKVLKNICSEEKKIEEKIEVIENQDTISAKQILRKMMVLEHPNNFIQIYQDDAIDDLYNMLPELENQNDNTLLNLGKNEKIANWANKNLKDFNDIVPQIDESIKGLLMMSIRSKLLWDLSQELDLFDGSSKNIILYGAPGTGKTFRIEEFKKQQTLRENICETVQFHPSYSYEDFIEGFKPIGVGENSQMKFELVNGEFKDFCIRAKNEKNKKYYFIIDEINRANLSAVFGELMYCLEYRYKEGNGSSGLLTTQYSKIIENMTDEEIKKKAFIVDDDGKVKFGIPDNVYIIGMMNDVDRSIDAFDLALRRRFKWIKMDCNYGVIDENINYNNREDFIKACKNLNNFISIELNLGKSYEFGHSFFLKINDILQIKKNKVSNRMMKTLFDNYLESTLKEYLRANFSEKDIDDKLKKAKEKFQILDLANNEK